MFLCFALALCAVSPACAATIVPAADAPPVLHARSAILLEAVTGTVLFQQDADLPIPPASLTKLMTLHIALSEIEAGRLSPAEEIVPGPHSWAKNMPPHSSLMFLGPDQRLTVRQLLEGLVVVSGNDAAVAVAERVAGSVPAFVAMMNSEAGREGYRVMHFTEPAGLSAANEVTAREYAAFCRVFITLHPDALRTLFSLRRFTYPLPENITNGSLQEPITQANRNTLLGRYAGLDGLKTGFIDESGYNMAATAVRGGMRLIAVVLGVPDAGGVSGDTLRAMDSAAVLDYGFAAFTTVTPAYAPPAAVRIWKGRQRSLVPVVSTQPLVAVRKTDAGRVTTIVDEAREIVAPVRAGQDLGQVSVMLDGKSIARFPLKAADGVPSGGVLRRALDSVALFFRRLFGVSTI
jgi:serine-type D-Ala-D-Ala carboxypeptidase (penicillin-binding protein 5/6)